VLGSNVEDVGLDEVVLVIVHAAAEEGHAPVLLLVGVQASSDIPHNPLMRVVGVRAHIDHPVDGLVGANLIRVRFEHAGQLGEGEHRRDGAPHPGQLPVDTAG